MDLKLSGHTALITGSSGGIGAQIAAHLAVEGCAVLVHGRDRARADTVAERIVAAGGDASVVLADLADTEQAAELAEQAAGHGVDILVNNAGPFSEHDWNTVTPADWAESFRTNVVSVAALTQAMLPDLRQRGWGRVVTVGTRAVVTPLPNMVEYSAAKAAVANLTVSLAQHLGGSGVTANCISPGVTLTPGLQAMFQRRPEYAGAEWSEIEPAVTTTYAPNPCGRLGRPDDIANAVAFLASPGADYINGVNLRVDGGITGAL